MSERDEGGAAFPAMAVSPAGDVYHDEGMSLRDYFAGQLLASEKIASFGNEALSEFDEEIIAKGRAMRAKAIYAMADAMLAERNK